MRPFLSITVTAFAILASHAAGAASMHYDIAVPDMECESCSATLVQNFRAQPIVSGTRADIEHRILHVTVQEGKNLSPYRIERIVRDSGFTPASIRLGAR